jgi:hypothetical protein
MMKAITILQPWASLIACGAKQIETRSWKTSYRGPLAIHAAKAIPNINLFTPKVEKALWNQNTPFGKVIAIAELIDCQEMTMDKIVLWRDVYGKDEIIFGDFTPGRYAWILSNIQAIKPVPAKGMQRIWNWAGDIENGY